MGANIDAINNNGDTMLHSLIKSGNSELCDTARHMKILISNGVDIKQKNQDNLSAFDLYNILKPSHKQKPEILELLAPKPKKRCNNILFF